MGKVYDALQRAEEQRARRLREDERSVPHVPAREVTEALREAARPAATARRPFWKRLLSIERGGRTLETASTLNKRRIAMLQPDAYVSEQFRTLRARIDALGARKPIHTIAVTSALPGEGKTLSSLNLALVTSMSVGRRTLLVDCDMRSPRVAKSLGLHAEVGLAEVIEGRADPQAAIVRAPDTSLDVLPVHDTPPNPSELLASRAMSELVQDLAASYDRVILDIPPVLGLPDAKTVSDLCDGIVVIVRADRTPQDDVNSALEILDPERLLGVVLNGVDEDPGRYGYTR